MISVSTVTMMMVLVLVVMVPVRMLVGDRLQVETGNAGRDVQPGLTLHADWLQRIGIGRAADQEVTAKTDTDRRVGTAQENWVCSVIPRSRPMRLTVAT
jgi:hypothetical protein